jgi:tRNA-2-methylthio-N6-dimethylallyladenosine synthase
MSKRPNTYFIKTFGCQANLADSERIAGYYQSRGYKPAKNLEDADVIVINTCVVREQAEDRVYGLVRNLASQKTKNPNLKIVVTGCLVGAAAREPSGTMMKKMRKMLPQVDEFLPIEEVGFEYDAIRQSDTHAWVPISVGCNNYCSYCIVPFSRGKEVSRPFEEILNEVKELAKKGFSQITLVGQNVNSYGADIINSKVKRRAVAKAAMARRRQNSKFYQLPNGRKIKPVWVKHLGRIRIPTLFPHLLEEVCKIKGIKKVSFISSNPWDFSDELISVIAKDPKIDRNIHLPVQSGDDEILRKMNRWYMRDEYLELVAKLKSKIKNVKISTDIIVGFPSEGQEQFENTIRLAKEVGFSKAYIACYSPRPGTAAWKVFADDIPHTEKDKRFHILDKLINKEEHI